MTSTARRNYIIALLIPALGFGIYRLIDDFIIDAPWNRPSKKESGKQVVEIRAELVAASNPAKPQEIAPYDRSLVFNEYDVDEVIDGFLEAPVIRVAHWAVVNGEAQEVPSSIGASLTLSLAPFDSEGPLASIHATDDLPLDLAIPTFMDHGASIALVAPPDEVRFDYGDTFSGRMKLYWLLREQLEVVVLGSSHGGLSLDPNYLELSDDHPRAISFCCPASGIPLQSRLADRYIVDLPELKWVIWCVSPRWFNSRYDSSWKLKVFSESPGARFDEAGDPPGIPGVVSTAKAEIISDLFDPLGWRRIGSTPKFRFENSEIRRAAVIERCQKIDFAWNAEAAQQLTNSIQAFEKSGVNVLLYLPPFHPDTIEANAIDPDETGPEDLQRIVKHLTTLAASSERLHFADYNLAGHHDILPWDFRDTDHLTPRGAAKFTARIRKKLSTLDPAVFPPR